MNRRVITERSGQMITNEQKNSNTIQLKFDGRNKDSKMFHFDLIAEGDCTNRDFFDKVGVKRMVR